MGPMAEIRGRGWAPAAADCQAEAEMRLRPSLSHLSRHLLCSRQLSAVRVGVTLCLAARAIATADIVIIIFRGIIIAIPGVIIIAPSLSAALSLSPSLSHAH